MTLDTKAFRVLRPGGQLVIADMHIPGTWMGRWCPMFPSGPPTMHPQFTGCLKCHNGDLK